MFLGEVSNRVSIILLDAWLCVPLNHYHLIEEDADPHLYQQVLLLVRMGDDDLVLLRLLLLS